MRKEDKVRLGICDSKTKKEHNYQKWKQSVNPIQPYVYGETVVTQYTNAIIPYRLSIQSMLENPIVKDVRVRLFGGGV